MLALIDGDAIVYRAGFASQCTKLAVSKLVDGKEVETTYFDKGITKKHILQWISLQGFKEEDYQIDTYIDAQPVENALQNAKKLMKSILNNLLPESYRLYLERKDGKPNFRYSVATILPYKGNRSGLIKPVHYNAIREYLITQWNAELIEGMEVDDKLGIEQCKTTTGEDVKEDSTIICSIDKDLKMIPGHHYNIVTHVRTYITKEKALENFYLQVLQGDRIDNIPGLKGIGPKRAEKILLGCKTEYEMFKKCHEQYGKNKRAAHIYEICNLLWILRSEKYGWQPPVQDELITNPVNWKD